MSKRAVIYARVSTEEQGKGYSLTTQIDSCKNYAHQRGHRVVAQFQDMYTGTQIDRPGLNALFRFVEDKTADVVVVHDIDRLSREVANQAIIEMELSRSGLKVEYVLGQYEDTPEGELLKLVKSGIAQYENRQRSERSRRGMRGRAQAGYVLMPAARAPYGYDYVSDKHKGWLVINEQEAAVVRMMYDWLVVAGLSPYAIARKLWEHRILTKGDIRGQVNKGNQPCTWHASTVRKMLTNTVYRGIWLYGKKRLEKVDGKSVKRKAPESERIPVSVPAIVSEEMWQDAQRCLGEHRERSSRSAQRDYLLRGLIFCPCGRRWQALRRNKLNRTYYRCAAPGNGFWMNQCTIHFSLRADVLEQAVWAEVTSIILEPENLKREIQRHRARGAGDTERLTRRAEAVDLAIAEVDRKINILLDEILTGEFSHTVIDTEKRALHDQRDSLSAEAERIKQELQTSSISAEQEAQLESLVEEIRQSLGEQTFEVKRRVLELLRLRIDVISKSQVKVSGIISPGGSIVDLAGECAHNTLRGCLDAGERSNSEHGALAHSSDRPV